jgi:putative IMPACT (imprinted ancient) family translation regulator
MKLINTITETVKKSKFIGLMYEVNNEEEINNILTNLKTEHKKARHMPYAYKLVNTAKKTDDKEPKNTAGLPIYNVIERNSLNNTLIVIVRYFGGTKLGVGLLTRTYANVANELVINKK